MVEHKQELNINSKGEHTMSETRICEICGVEFTPKSPSQKLCGNPECRKERRREYSRKNAEMYRELNRLYRRQEVNKLHRAEYDREYQKKHKAQIQQYKKMWYQKQRFFKHLDKGNILKNIYWFSLSKDEQQQMLDKISK